VLGGGVGVGGGGGGGWGCVGGGWGWGCVVVVCGLWGGGGRHLVLFMDARTDAFPAPFSRPVLLWLFVMGPFVSFTRWAHDARACGG